MPNNNNTGILLKYFRIFSDEINRCAAPGMTITVDGEKIIR